MPTREVGPIRKDVDRSNPRKIASRTDIRISIGSIGITPRRVALRLAALRRHPKKGLSGVKFDVTHGSAGTHNLIQTVGTNVTMEGSNHTICVERKQSKR